MQKKQLAVYPALRLMRLAVWARTVAAGVWHIDLLRAVAAFHLHFGAHGAAAVCEGGVGVAKEVVCVVVSNTR